MEDSKPFWFSKAIWANVATMLVGILVSFGVFSPEQGAVVSDAFPDLAIGLVTFVTGAAGAYGRYVATKQVV